MTDKGGVPTLKEAVRHFCRLLLLIRPYWVPLGKGIVLAVLLGLVSMVVPFISKLLIDQAYPSDNVGLMHVLVLGILAISVSSTVLGALSGFYSLFVSAHLNRAVRLMYFNHVQHMEARFFDEHRVGEINSRFADIDTSLGAANTVFQVVFTQGFYLLLVPPLLMWIDLPLALVALAGQPVIAVTSSLTGRLLRRSWKASAEANAELSGFQIEALSNIRTFKAMALESVAYARAERLTINAFALQMKASGLSEVVSATNGLVRAINAAAYTWYGWSRVLTHQVTLGEFMAFTAYVAYLSRPLSQVVGLSSTFQQAAVSINRLFEYLNRSAEQDPRVAYAGPATITRRLMGEFRFEGVSFSYLPERPVLDRLDMDIECGSVTALVGASGCGKTTILRLLLRFANPHGGRILYDGVPADRFSISDVRRQTAVVWQEVGLIKGTLWDNLTLGCDSEPSAGRVEAVLEMCGLLDVVASLPKGYQSEVAEWGTTLSAGQRQRVALARALLRDAPVLLLDEATANIDAQTESKILSTVLAHRGRRTIVVVTHRATNAAFADSIRVVRDGRVVGSGSHAHLWPRCEHYRRLFNGTLEEEAGVKASNQPHAAPAGVVRL